MSASGFWICFRMKGAQLSYTLSASLSGKCVQSSCTLSVPHTKSFLFDFISLPYHLSFEAQVHYDKMFAEQLFPNQIFYLDWLCRGKWGFSSASASSSRSWEHYPHLHFILVKHISFIIFTFYKPSNGFLIRSICNVNSKYSYRSRSCGHSLQTILKHKSFFF